MNQQCTGALNHFSIPTHDTIAAARFFEQHLGCEIVTAGTHVLLKRDGFDIVLEHVDSPPAWPVNFHLGFEMASLREVTELHRAFTEAGVHIETPVFNNSRGSRFFCRMPEGVMLEINTREDKLSDWRQLF